MEWKEYLGERMEAIPELAKKHTDNGQFSDRPILLRLMRFVNAFVQGQTDSRVIIMYGLRGIGKSTILFQLYNKLVSTNFPISSSKVIRIPKENILYLSLDQSLLQTELPETKSALFDTVKKFVEEIHGQKVETLDKKLIILIDEAQFDKEWAVAAKTLFDSSKNIFLVITGSSALALNLNTDTARRAIREPLFPLSFREYQMLKDRIFAQKGTGEALKSLVLQNDIGRINILNTGLDYLIEKNKEKNKYGLNFELNEYLISGGFPYNLTSSKEITYRRLVDMITRIVTQDLPTITNFETNSQPEILRIIGSLAMSNAGQLSQDKLSQNLGIAASKVKTILDSLEKTHLIFAVKPYPNVPMGGGNKIFKYYFLSPTLLAAIRHLNGKTNITPEEVAVLWETAVASTLFKLGYTSGTVYNLFYDPRKDTNVDFILQNPLSGEIIPLEVGLNKDDAQIKNAMEFYGTKYGVVISDYPKITSENGILKIPFWLFLYL